MSQSSQNVPVVTTNLAGTRRQVNLRDYLNQRVAPFLKKAIHESLDSEVEFPLQWLGEHLIQQSILYEGNPDRTNIRERFVYTHDQPTNQASQAVVADPSTPSISVPAVATAPSPSPMPEVEQSVTSNTAMNGSSATHHTSGDVNGAPGQLAESESVSRDTDMGGTT